MERRFPCLELSFSELASINYIFLMKSIHKDEAIAFFLGNPDAAVQWAWGEAFGREAVRVIHWFCG